MALREQIAECPKGRENPNFRCRFCPTKIHRGDSGCGCSTFNEPVTFYASLCIPCANKLEVLMEPTRLGMIHRKLVREALHKYMPSGD